MKTSSLVPVSLRMRLFAWLNIAVQAAFPLAVAFTPAVAGTAGSDGRFLHEQAVSAMQTRVYTLGGVSLDIENYCTVRLFFEQVYLSEWGVLPSYARFQGIWP